MTTSLPLAPLTSSDVPAVVGATGLALAQYATKTMAHEAQMDELAKRLEINPLKFRLMNALDNTLSTATGQVFEDGVGIKATLEKIREVVLNDPSLRGYWEDLT